MSKMFTLNSQDFLKGLAVAVLMAAFKVLLEMVQVQGFNLTPADWQAVGVAALTAFAAYLSKNLLSDENGAVLGKFGGTPVNYGGSTGNPGKE